MHVVVALLIALLLSPVLLPGVALERDWWAQSGWCLAALLNSPSTIEGVIEEQAAEYLRAVQAQREAAAVAAEIAEQFLAADPNSLDQGERTRFLAALRALQVTADAAALLTPPGELAALHQRHVESLSLLAAAGDRYTAGMDTHDPSEYDRALTALTEGRELFDAVGSELEQLVSQEWFNDRCPSVSD